MKKKLLTLLLCIGSIVFSVVGLTACGHKHDYITIETAPTCLEQGFTTYTCNCGDSYVDDYVQALGHDFKDYVPDGNASYTNDGTKTATCDREGCGVKDTITDVGSKLQSEFAFNTLNVVDFKSSTIVPNSVTQFDFNQEITATGLKSYAVSLSSNGTNSILTKVVDLVEGNNKIYVFEQTYGQLENIYEITIRRKPMCLVTFSESGIDSQRVEEGDLATLPTTEPTKEGYTFTGWDFDFTTSIKEDTIINAIWNANTYTVKFDANGGEGVFEPIEVVCGNTFSLPQEQPTVTGHDFAGWYYGDMVLKAGDMVWDIPKNVTLTAGYTQKIFITNGGIITGLTSYGETLSQISIPSKVYNGTKAETIVAIGDYAFSDCYSLTSIEIGNSVTSIGEDAFHHCDSLTSVVIGNSVTSIGENAFLSCVKLVEVVNNSTYITVEKGSTDNGYLGYYALAVYNPGDEYQSKLSNDNGYIVYTYGEENILLGYEGKETALILPSYITKINKYAFV